MRLKQDMNAAMNNAFAAASLLLRFMRDYGLKLALVSVCVAPAFARPAPEVEKKREDRTVEQSLVMPAFQEPWQPIAALSDQCAKIFERALDGFSGVRYEPLLVTRRSVENGTFDLYVCNASASGASPCAALVCLYQAVPDGDIRIASVQDIGHSGMVGSYRAFEKPSPEAEASLQEALADNAEIVSVIPLLATTQVVAGRNYFFAANVTMQNSGSSPAFIIVYQPLRDKARVTKLDVLSMP
jgi:hypothetical protein